MVSRDMKPSNIYFDSHMDIKIGTSGMEVSSVCSGDFGLSKEVNPQDKLHKLNPIVKDQDLEQSSLVGTFLYLAPEVS